MLEIFAPRETRRLFKEVLVLSVPIVVVLSMFFSGESYVTITRLYGVFFASIFLWLILFALDSFFYSMYFRGMKSTLPELGFSRTISTVPFEVLYIAFQTDPKDVTRGFIHSSIGQAIFSRLNIEKAALESFLEKSKPVNAEKIRFNGEPTLASYVGTLYDADPEFAQFLSGLGFKRTEITGTAEWVANLIESEKTRLRWWSRDSLGRIRGIGKEWAYGETRHLEKYGKYITHSDFSIDEKIYQREVAALEKILIKNERASALVVGEDNDDALRVVYELADQITKGTVLPDIEHKRIFLLNNKTLISATGSKTDFKREFLAILDEAKRAEHIIFVISHFASFIYDTEVFGVDVVKVLEPYIQSPDIQIVALTDKKSFIDHLEKNRELIQGFEKILIAKHERGVILHTLEEKISKIERENKILFTYPALLAIADSKNDANDLLSGIVSKMNKENKKIVTLEDVKSA